MNPRPITYLAETDFRNEHRRFGMKPHDRRSHLYILGKTGCGKSTLIKNLLIQDIHAGHGVGIIDAHGDLMAEVLQHVPRSRTSEVVYFDPGDRNHPIGFNILGGVEVGRRPLVASHLISIFKSIWHDSWGPRLEYILYNAVAALLDCETATLLGIPRLLEDKTFRREVIRHIKDPIVRKFWESEYEGYSANFRTEAIAPIQNKVGQLLSSGPMRNVLGQVKSKVDFKFMMDSRRILLCNLSKGAIGEDKTRLLGSIIVTKLFLDALRRVDQPEEARQDFYLYIDEVQNLATTVLASILSESRKYRLNLTLSHQYLAQLPEEIQEGILGNVGSIVTFRLGSTDARTLAPEFAPEFSVTDLENLDRYQIYVKLLVDGLASRPFSARTLPSPLALADVQDPETIRRISRERYGTPRAEIEEKINRWLLKKEQGTL